MISALLVNLEAVHYVLHAPCSGDENNLKSSHSCHGYRKTSGYNNCTTVSLSQQHGHLVTRSLGRRKGFAAGICQAYELCLLGHWLYRAIRRLSNSASKLFRLIHMNSRVLFSPSECRRQNIELAPYMGGIMNHKVLRRPRARLGATLNTPQTNQCICNKSNYTMKNYALYIYTYIYIDIYVFPCTFPFSTRRTKNM